jgi:hypothetical protein
MKTLLISFGLLITTSTFAQQVTSPEGYEAKENLRELGSTDGTGTVQTFDNRYEGVKGSPYVFEQFRQGEVYFKSKKKVKVNELNYNCMENELVYKDPATKVIRMMNKFQVDLFTFSDGTENLTFVPLNLYEDKEAIFAQMLYNKASLVYKVYAKDWLKANYEGGYSADRKYDEFVDKYSLYFMKDGEHTLYKAKNRCLLHFRKRKRKSHPSLNPINWI